MIFVPTKHPTKYQRAVGERTNPFLKVSWIFLNLLNDTNLNSRMCAGRMLLDDSDRLGHDLLSAS